MFQALLQKADILHMTQDYDLALIYYSRGHKVYPRNKGFIDGMKKSENEINKCKKGKGQCLIFDIVNTKSNRPNGEIRNIT